MSPPPISTRSAIVGGSAKKIFGWCPMILPFAQNTHTQTECANRYYPQTVTISCRLEPIFLRVENIGGPRTGAGGGGEEEEACLPRPFSVRRAHQPLQKGYDDGFEETFR